MLWHILDKSYTISIYYSQNSRIKNICEQLNLSTVFLSAPSSSNPHDSITVDGIYRSIVISSNVLIQIILLTGLSLDCYIYYSMSMDTEFFYLSLNMSKFNQ